VATWQAAIDVCQLLGQCDVQALGLGVVFCAQHLEPCKLRCNQRDTDRMTNDGMPPTVTDGTCRILVALGGRR
jgi:hypothetical protein